MHISELDTPALTVDLDVLERNIYNMAALCREIDINLRVHTKTHKVPEIATMQVAAGSKGITSQKLGEAEAMVDGGLDDILIPYNIVGKPKLQRLTQLRQTGEDYRRSRFGDNRRRHLWTGSGRWLHCARAP